jgi:class 3 adenylate cyclase
VLTELRRDGASTDEIALLREAAREIQRVDELFRPYLPQQLAEQLRENPALRRLGGEEREVSVLFADLAGFTTFSETRRPTDVIGMLNEYWAAVVPVIEQAGGTIEHFAGDGVLVLFNSVVAQADHAVRAARCALAIQRVTAPIATSHPGWPRFRIGINSGPVVVGNVGAAGRRSFASIGDTTNLGSRLMSAGEAGQVVVAAPTRAGIEQDPEFALVGLGPVRVKGKREPVEAWLLEPASR